MSEVQPGAISLRPAGEASEIAPRVLTASEVLRFERFAHENEQSLLRGIVSGGAATRQEAESALWKVLGDVWRRWPLIDHPVAYIKLSAIRHIAMERQRDAARRSREWQYTRLRPVNDVESVWDDREWVMQLLRKLPTHQAETLALVYDGLTTQEISYLLGATEPAIRKRLSDARRRARSMLPAPSRESPSLSGGKSGAGVTE